MTGPAPEIWSSREHLEEVELVGVLLIGDLLQLDGPPEFAEKPGAVQVAQPEGLGSRPGIVESEEVGLLSLPAAPGLDPLPLR